MKKLLYIALILTVLPFTVASLSAETASAPAEDLGVVETVSAVESLEEAPSLPAEFIGSAASEAESQDAVFGEFISQACLDSGVACSSAQDCDSVCGNLSCVCNGTCQYCG